MCSLTVFFFIATWPKAEINVSEVFRYRSYLGCLFLLSMINRINSMSKYKTKWDQITGLHFPEADFDARFCLQFNFHNVLVISELLMPFQYFFIAMNTGVLLASLALLFTVFSLNFLWTISAKIVIQRKWNAFLRLKWSSYNFKIRLISLKFNMDLARAVCSTCYREYFHLIFSTKKHFCT